MISRFQRLDAGWASDPGVTRETRLPRAKLSHAFGVESNDKLTTLIGDQNNNGHASVVNDRGEKVVEIGYGRPRGCGQLKLVLALGKLNGDVCRDYGAVGGIRIREYLCRPDALTVEHNRDSDHRIRRLCPYRPVDLDIHRRVAGSVEIRRYG